MSLHKFAEQVASQGRGDDSLLVHMTPDEVRNLQKFAEANGTTLTINPTTGLPEAGLLSDLFKSIAPIALGAFLGPAGFGLSASMAGLATGGITALATGSLSRGLMAGLGAYGGAGLGDSLMTAGGGMSAANAATTAQQQLSGANLALGEAMPAQVAEQFTKDAVTRMTPSGAVSAGFNKAIASPTAAMDFAKNNLTNIGMAAAPIMAGAMVPTTTEMPDPKDRYIRMMDYNINPDTGKPDPLYGMREMTPIKTSDFKGKTFQSQRDLFRQQNPNPYELGVGSLNQPPQQQPARMNTGGIVALAAGGAPTVLSDEALFQKTGSWEAAAAARDAQNNALNAYNWQQQAAERDAANAAASTSAGMKFATGQGQTPDQYYGTVANQFNELTGFGDKYANATDAQIDAAIRDANTKYGVSQTDFLNSLEKGGGSTALEYAVGAGNMGLSGLNQNINDYLAAARRDPTFNAKTGLQQQEAARAAMGTVNMNEADVLRATGKTIAELFPSTLTKPVSVTPGGTQLPGATVYDNGAYGNYGSGPATGVDYRGNTVSIATPGDIITNPDGTRTVVPNVPGRPYGGFTGVEQLKSRYTAGGGSLGYTAPIPKDPEATFNKMTDDSLDAYNFLMGKGKNLSQRTATADRPAMRRYDEAVLGRKIPKLTKPGTTTTKTGTSTGTIGNPQSYFDEKAYLAANPSVAEEIRTGKSVSGQPTQFKSGYDHYMMYGKAEGRPFTGDYEGYTTALALANAAQQSGGGDAGPSGPSGTTSTVGLSSNEANSITGLAAAPNDSISVTDAVSSPSDSAAAAAAATSGDGDGDGDSAGDDAVGGYYSRGKLNYRSKNMAMGGATGYAMGGGLGSLGSYSDGGRLLKGPGDGVSDSIPATIGAKRQPARLADGEFVIPARIVSELGNGSTDAGAKKLYAMMDRVQRARGKTTGKNKVAANSRADKYLPA
jgi:hypothetical protein